MGNKLFTDIHYRNLKAGEKDHFSWDNGATGLGMKVTPAGRKIWVLQLRFPGHDVQTKRTLGMYPALGLADARTRAGQWRDLVREGKDPSELEAKAREEADRERKAARKNTFRSVAESYIEGRSGKRQAAKAAREIRRLLISKWGDRPIASITTRDVREHIGTLAKESVYTADFAWGQAKLIFEHAVDQDPPLIAVSPCASLKKRKVLLGKEKQHRKRVLSDEEVFALWRATRRLEYPERQLYQLLLMTGCRLNEIAQAEWKEFTGDLRKALRDHRSGKPLDWSTVPNSAKVWTIPPERFKSDEQHTVPLTDRMCAVLATMPVNGPYLLSHSGDHPIWPNTPLKRKVDAGMLHTLRALARRRGDDPSEVELPHWVNHDLRRVVRSHLSALGVADNVAEMTIGHAKKGLQRVYDQYKFLPEIRAALESWSDKLAQLTGDAPLPPSNVVRLRKLR